MKTFGGRDGRRERKGHTEEGLASESIVLGKNNKCPPDLLKIL